MLKLTNKGHHMKKLNQKGFSHFEIALLILVLAALGFAGYTVYQKNKPESQTTTTVVTKQEETKKAEEQKEPESKPNTDENYLVIAEWGVKIKVPSANKLQYSYDKNTGSTSNGDYDSEVLLTVRPEFLQDKTCKLSVTIDRSKTVPGTPTYKKVGDNYYFLSGSPYGCGNQADDTLNTSIRDALLTLNIQAN
jgi:hypothetical protein